MIPATNDAPEIELYLATDEQWAAHHALLTDLDRGVADAVGPRDPTLAVALLTKIEDGYFSFTRSELDHLRRACNRHAVSPFAPERDRDPARTVVEKINQLCEAWALG